MVCVCGLQISHKLTLTSASSRPTFPKVLLAKDTLEKLLVFYRVLAGLPRLVTTSPLPIQLCCWCCRDSLPNRLTKQAGPYISIPAGSSLAPPHTRARITTQQQPGCFFRAKTASPGALHTSACGRWCFRI